LLRGGGELFARDLAVGNPQLLCHHIKAL
jgi:hypothetical protein